MEVNTLADIQAGDTDLLLLDLDNTLYEYERCHNFALNQLLEACGAELKLSAEQLHHLYYDCRKAVSHAHLGTANSHSRLFYIQGMVERATGTTNAGLIMRLHDIYWNNYLNHMQLFDDAIAFLEQYKAAGIPVIMVTDMLATIQFKKVEQLNISKYFNYIVTSEEAGVEKPHPYIFDLAVQKGLQLNPQLQNITVVGDNVKKDIYTSAVYQVTVYHTLRHE
jgi:HAD superfamily hydrolase (TIGR01549 family)